MSDFKAWTSADGLVGVEIDSEGCWLRMREHPADVWEAPVEMIPAGGNGALVVSNFGISAVGLSIAREARTTEGGF